MTALFESVIFGPIRSRRLGLSLGVNLLPEHAKICNFDCIYCECGSNQERRGEGSTRRFANIEVVEQELERVLKQLITNGETLDVITFAGNGEPTLHPQFEEVIDLAIELRNRYAPQAKISVLSNATMLDHDSVTRALHKVDNNILKLDAAINTMATTINRPVGKYDTSLIISQMSQFKGQCIVQTMFLRGDVDGIAIDNTQEPYISSWIDAIRAIAPRQIMIYSLDRDTPCKGLQQLTRDELQQIACRAESETQIPCSFA